jgi:hypothetical protein
MPSRVASKISVKPLFHNFIVTASKDRGHNLHFLTWKFFFAVLDAPLELYFASSKHYNIYNLLVAHGFLGRFEIRIQP